MLTRDLFDKILINPAYAPEIDRLKIVSGFATASMADRHMAQLRRLDKPLTIDLIVGMTSLHGLPNAQHVMFQTLARDLPYNINFSCRYICDAPPVHAKAYCWLSGDQPKSAFIGSANYTSTAFSPRQTEAMTKADADQVAGFYQTVRTRTINCLESRVSEQIAFTQTRQIPHNTTAKDSVTLSLLTRRTNDTPAKSGINWGQRDNRDRNQAYINVPSDILQTGFFPERGVQFTVLTDDNYSFVMIRAQDSGKALQTTQNNALLGEYLRSRIGVPSAAPVTKHDLEKYGRTDITFTKIDNETYLMDFSI